MKILLAGPGTGKTTRVKDIIASDYGKAARILVLSFTNATVNDLTADFVDHENIECFTLHKYAIKISHHTDRYVLAGRAEEDPLRDLAEAIKIDFSFFCERLGCITFNAMIAECLAFLQTNPVYATEQIGSMDLLIVDEYQDFNPVERDLIDVIACFASDCILLGDDDQSIYGFKDADPEGIIRRYQDDSVGKIKHANNCYRCPDVVVEHAANLIQKNTNRVEKPWIRTGKEGTFDFVQVRSQVDAVEHVVADVVRIRAESPEATFLVLSPTGFCVDGVTAALDARGIPYADFWNTDLAADDYSLVWWMRAIYTARGLLNLLLLWKSLTAHFRKKLKRVLAEALAQGFDEAKLLATVAKMYDDSLARHVGNPPEPKEFVAERPEFTEVVSRLDEADPSGSAESLLKELQPQANFDPSAVNVMSIHKSKGLQADIVYIMGLVDGVIPNDSRGIDTIEAQRRLLFVGATRALLGLCLVSWIEWDSSVHKVDKTAFRYQHRKQCYYGRTSRFVSEMKEGLSN